MKKILLLLAFMSALLVSCEKSEETNPDANASISVSPIELNFDATGGDKTVTITSTGEWSVYTSDEWFELSATSGQNGDKITISADPYDNIEEERYAYIDFYCGSSATSLFITQNAKENSITVTPAEIKTEVEGGKYEITVMSTDEWTVTADNWIIPSADKGNNGDIVTLTVNYNETAEERIGTVTFDCKGKTAIITVTQQPDNSLIIQFKDPYFLDALLKKHRITWNDVEYYVDVDKNNDGKISEKEAACIEVLDLSSTLTSSIKIRNAEEIKYFTQLRYLSFQYNSTTSLDLSKNTALEYLDCSDSHLTSLDLSKNTALEYLDCWGNLLTALDVSNNTALTNLSCSDNLLTSLDLSNNTALKYLKCRLCGLTSLDLSKNTALTELWCDDNDLTTLDLSNNIALTYLDCNGNQLTSLDISNNSALTELYCVENQLTTLDLSNNTALTELECYLNDITSLDVSMCRDLKYFRCIDYYLDYVSLPNNAYYYLVVIWPSTKLPLESLKIYKYHIIDENNMSAIKQAYGEEIIEYVE